MKTKLFLILALMVCSLISFSQTKNSISLYSDIETEGLSETDVGILYKRDVSNRQSLQGYIGASFDYRALSIGTDYFYSVPIITERLLFLVGGGLQYEHFKKESSYLQKDVFNFRPQAGLGYTIPNFILELFAVYKPKLDLDGFEFTDVSSIQIGVGFHF